MPKKSTNTCLHRYKKVNIGRNGNEYLVYHCVKGCGHYVPIHLAKGKHCECWHCGKEIILTNEIMYPSQNVLIAKPHCLDCKKGKKKDVKPSALDAIAAFLEGNKI